jgi:hypothetical protein
MRTLFWTLVFLLDGDADRRWNGGGLLLAAVCVVLVVALWRLVRL